MQSHKGEVNAFVPELANQLICKMQPGRRRSHGAVLTGINRLISPPVNLILTEVAASFYIRRQRSKSDSLKHSLQIIVTFYPQGTLAPVSLSQQFGNTIVLPASVYEKNLFTDFYLTCAFEHYLPDASAEFFKEQSFDFSPGASSCKKPRRQNLCIIYDQAITLREIFSNATEFAVCQRAVFSIQNQQPRFAARRGRLLCNQLSRQFVIESVCSHIDAFRQVTDTTKTIDKTPLTGSDTPKLSDQPPKTKKFFHELRFTKELLKIQR
jgi:hypothetical protein